MNDRTGQLIQFITQRFVKRAGVQITPETRLITSGIIDSFSLLDVLMEAQRLTAKRIDTGRINPQDLDTVNGIFSVIDRAPAA